MHFYFILFHVAVFYLLKTYEMASKAAFTDVDYVNPVWIYIKLNSPRQWFLLDTEASRIVTSVSKTKDLAYNIYEL